MFILKKMIIDIKQLLLIICVFSLFYLCFLFFIQDCGISSSVHGKEDKEKTSFEPFTEEERQNPANPNLYIKGEYSKNGILNALQTSVVRFSESSLCPDLSVDLIGAIHFAEKEYYNELNQLFCEYDAVLYEMVIPPGMDYRTIAESLKQESLQKRNIPESDFSFNFSTRRKPTDPRIFLDLFARTQNWLGNTLQLVDQPSSIDYTPQNMIHADIDSDTFLREMINKGEIFDFFYQTVLESMLSGSETGLSPFVLLFTRNRTRALKRMVGEALLMSIDKDFKDTTIIGVRNRIAFRELSKTIDQGKKKIAIFYGSAHLPYFSVLLQEKYHFKKHQIRWITAWTMIAPTESVKKE